MSMIQCPRTLADVLNSWAVWARGLGRFSLHHQAQKEVLVAGFGFAWQKLCRAVLFGEEVYLKGVDGSRAVLQNPRGVATLGSYRIAAFSSGSMSQLARIETEGS